MPTFDGRRQRQPQAFLPRPDEEHLDLTRSEPLLSPVATGDVERTLDIEHVVSSITAPAATSAAQARSTAAATSARGAPSGPARWIAMRTVLTVGATGRAQPSHHRRIALRTAIGVAAGS
ncbi:MAG: hypothetical protein ABIR68_18510 [Ilumatobacteraceae bacterium]